MKKRQKGWFFPPQKPPKHKVPENVKPKYIKLMPNNELFNCLVDIYTNWYRNYFYFYSKYRSLSPNAISQFLETKFARLEYVGNNLFIHSYMRHTGQWLEIYTDISVVECLVAVKDDSHFLP